VGRQGRELTDQASRPNLGWVPSGSPPICRPGRAILLQQRRRVHLHLEHRIGMLYHPHDGCFRSQ
jgi:hypothetical protein